MPVHLYDMPCPHCGAPKVSMYRGSHVRAGAWRDVGMCSKCRNPVTHFRNDDDPYFRAAEERRMQKLFAEKVRKACRKDDEAEKAIAKAKAEGRYEEPLPVGGSVDSVQVTDEELAERVRRSALYGDLGNPDATPSGAKLPLHILLSMGFGQMSDEGGFGRSGDIEESEDDE